MNSQPKHTKHVLHALLTLISGGLWLPIWIWRSISNKIQNSRAGISLDQSTSPSIFNLLRIIRGICGFVFALQIIHVIGAVALLAKPEAAGMDIGGFFAILLIKIVALGVSGFMFFWLRGIINRLHTRKHGTPHPALAEKKLAL